MRLIRSWVISPPKSFLHEGTRRNTKTITVSLCLFVCLRGGKQLLERCASRNVRLTAQLLVKFLDRSFRDAVEFDDGLRSLGLQLLHHSLLSVGGRADAAVDAAHQRSDFFAQLGRTAI